MLPNKREMSPRSEDLHPSAGRLRRTERSVQTCGKPNALSSAFYSRRVARLQDQVDRLQQRNVDVEEEHRAARQSFQGRLQQLHESWQDCFDRHQQAWSRDKALAEAAWAEERHHLQAQIMQLTSALAAHPSKELMEDAAVQAGSFSGKSRSSQTPTPSTPRPTRSTTDGVFDLLRTQSLPFDSQEWLGALVSSKAPMAEFGHAAAEYGLTVAEGSLSTGDYSQAASSFARAAALYAQGISQDAPATDSFMSCSSSEASDDMMTADFFPLQEVTQKAEVAPVPDQSWWEEFGEWESASKVSCLPAPQHVTCLTQPRLVIENQVVRLPVARPDARLPYGSFPGLVHEPTHSAVSMHITAEHDAIETTSYASKASQDVAPRTPSFTGSIFTSQENFADNDDIWDDILQAAAVAAKPGQPEDSAELHAHLAVQKARFPSPSPGLWDLQESQDTHVNLSLPQSRFRSSSSNLWGLQDTTFPVMEISLPERTFAGDVTYTPVEAFQPSPSLPTQKTVKSNIFSGTTGFPVSFSSSFHDDASSHVEVMDMSAGDLVSVGGPESCPWDGTNSPTQHSTPSFPKSSMEERFAADLDADSAVQHEQVAYRMSSSAQMAPTEQASQTGAAQAEQSVQSRQRQGSLLSMHSVGQKRYLATLDELAGLLLPQSCRVAARVSTKLPPLDHDPTLPPLPEGFVLPPEIHPVVGTYRTAKPATSSISQTAAAQEAANAASHSVKAPSTKAAQSAVVDDLQQVQQARGKWLHPKLPPPRPRASVAGDLADQAAASMNISTQELLDASPMTELLKDVLSYSPDQQQHDIDLPTFTSRLADSGFMTCQLAQILAPIRAASAPLSSSGNAPATPPKTAHPAAASAAATANPAVAQDGSSTPAAAVADPAQEARLEAAAECLLAQIGIDCSSQPMARADSDACSEFEMVPWAESDKETAFTIEEFAAKQWLGPKVQLVKTTSAPLHSVYFNAAGSSVFHSPSQSSATEHDLFEREADLLSMDGSVASSVVSVEDVKLDVAGEGSELTTTAPHPAAVCFAAVHSSNGKGLDDSASESDSYSESDLSMVSASSFGEEMMAEDFSTPDEWEVV